MKSTIVGVGPKSESEDERQFDEGKSKMAPELNNAISLRLDKLFKQSSYTLA